MYSKNKISSDTIYIVVTQVLAFFLRACVYISIGRSLGVDALGTVVFCLAIIEIAANITVLGFDRAIIRFGASAFAMHNFHRFNSTFVLCLAVPGIISLIILAAGKVILHMIGSSALAAEVTQFLTISVWAIPPLVIARVIVGSFRASRNLVYYSILVVLTPFIWLVSVIAGIILGGSLTFVVYGYVVSVALPVVLGLMLRRRHSNGQHESTLNGDINYRVRPIFRYAAIMASTGLSLLLINRVDRLLLGVLSTMDQTGLYGAAASITTYIGFMSMSIGIAIAPQVSILHDKNQISAILDLYKKSVQGATFLAMPIVVILFFEPLFFMRLFGKDFVDGDTVIRVLALAFFSKAIAGPAGYVLTQAGREKWEFYNTMLLLGLHVILCVILIPSFGALGAAISLLASLTTLSSLRIVEVRVGTAGWGLTEIPLIPLVTFASTSTLFILCEGIIANKVPWAANVVPMLLIAVNATVLWLCCPYDGSMVRSTMRQAHHDLKRVLNFSVGN